MNKSTMQHAQCPNDTEKREVCFMQKYKRFLKFQVANGKELKHSNK